VKFLVTRSNKLEVMLKVYANSHLLSDSLTVHDVVTHNVILFCNGVLVQIHVWFVARHAEPAIPVARQIN
jgi:hypothetical protein